MHPSERENNAIADFYKRSGLPCKKAEAKVKTWKQFNKKYGRKEVYAMERDLISKLDYFKAIPNFTLEKQEAFHTFLSEHGVKESDWPYALAWCRTTCSKALAISKRRSKHLNMIKSEPIVISMEGVWDDKDTHDDDSTSLEKAPSCSYCDVLSQDVIRLKTEKLMLLKLNLAQKNCMDDNTRLQMDLAIAGQEILRLRELLKLSDSNPQELPEVKPIADQQTMG